jgi:hypothetical protein
VLRLVRLLVPLGAFVVEGPAAALGAALFQEAGLWLAARVSEACQRRWTRGLFLAAWCLRAVVAIPLHYVNKLENGNGALFQDDYTNDLVADWLVRIARGEGLSIFPGHQHLLDSTYTYLLMVLYAIFGHTPLLPKLLNASVGALCGVLIFDVARRAFRPPVAMLAAFGATVMPSLVLWSIVTLKESLVLLLALLGLWAIQQLLEQSEAHKRASMLVLLVVVMVVSLDLRSTTSLILLMLLPLVLLRRVPAWRLALAALALTVVVGGGLAIARGQQSGRPIEGVAEDIVLQIRHRRAQEAAQARSIIRPQLDVISPEGRTGLPEAEAASDATPFTFAGDVLDPLGYALLAPAPWQAHSLTELAASGEMLVWYVLLGASFFAWRTGPRERTFVLCLVGFGVANWLVLAASEGNLGNLLRHRLLLAPSLLILGAAGLDWLWLRAGRPWPARLPALRLQKAGVES